MKVLVIKLGGSLFTDHPVDLLYMLFSYLCSLSLWRAGSVAGPEKLQPLLDKNQEMFNAFVKAVEELAVLRNNLNKTEVSLGLNRVFIIFIIIINSSSSSVLRPTGLNPTLLWLRCPSASKMTLLSALIPVTHASYQKPAP